MIKSGKKISAITIPTPFPVGDVNAYVIKGDALTLIDSGIKTEEAKQALIAGLSNLQLRLEDIEQIVITHHHVDHVGGIDFFGENIPVIGHEYNNRWMVSSSDFINQYNHFFKKLALEMGLPEDYVNKVDKIAGGEAFTCSRSLTSTFKEGDEVPGLPGWVVYETPGHALGHVVLFRESDGALIGGDMLLQHVSPNPIIEPPLEENGERPKSQLMLNDSLEKLKQLPISAVYAGHGDLIFDPDTLIEKRLASQHGRAMRVRSMLEEEPSTVFQICQKLFPHVYKKQIGLTLSETLAQFDYLLKQDLIKGENTKEGIIYFSK
ncbi:MAG: MBL fold metallo-hydrolase [Bacillus sp. (in: firmicutes)]